MANVIPTPKEMAEAAQITLDVIDHLVGYAKQLKAVFAKTISMPRLALLEVEKILTEIDKSFTAVDEATKNFYEAIQRPEQFVDNDDVLHDMSSARLITLVEEKRGHCHEIENVYRRYLSGVLSTLFQNPADRETVKTILSRLSSADGDFFARLAQVAVKMRNVAREAYRLKLIGKRQEAMDLMTSAPLTLLEMRDKLNDASVTMRQICNDFIKAARVAPL